MNMTTDQQMRAIHLQDQAKEYGCEVETYVGSNAVFLRNVPSDLLGETNFQQFVEQCQRHNVAATRAWKETGVALMTDQEYANLQQQWGDEYKFSDHKRGERITYRSFDGTIKQGTIIWVQGPGETPHTHTPLPAQYIVEPDNPSGTMGFEFVSLGAVQS